MTCRLSGAARNTLPISKHSTVDNYDKPKERDCTISVILFRARNDSPARHQSTKLQYPSTIPSLPSNAGVIISKAGMIPTRPAANGIVPVATATVCSMTFSCGVNGFRSGRSLGRAVGRVLRSPKPTRADWRDIIDTQPICQYYTSASMGKFTCLQAKICIRHTQQDSGSHQITPHKVDHRTYPTNNPTVTARNVKSFSSTSSMSVIHSSMPPSSSSTEDWRGAGMGELGVIPEHHSAGYGTYDGFIVESSTLYQFPVWLKDRCRDSTEVFGTCRQTRVYTQD